MKEGTKDIAFRDVILIVIRRNKNSMVSIFKEYLVSSFVSRMINNSNNMTKQVDKTYVIAYVIVKYNVRRNLRLQESHYVINKALCTSWKRPL